MAVGITKLVWRANLPHTEKMVLLCLADHADKDGEKAFPSIATMCAELDVTRRTVQKSLSSLRQRGIIRIVAPANSFNRLTNEYAFDVSALKALPKIETQASQVLENHENQTSSDAQEGRTSEHGGAFVETPQPSFNHQDKKDGELTTFVLHTGVDFIEEVSHQNRQQELADRHNILIGEGVKIPDGVPAIEMIVIYNGGLSPHGLPRCVMVTQDRARKLSARFKDCGRSLEVWRDVLRDKVSASNFLMGHSQARPGQEPFKASLDWIIGPQNFVKIVEGNYVRQSTSYGNVK